MSPAIPSNAATGPKKKSNKKKKSARTLNNAEDAKKLQENGKEELADNGEDEAAEATESEVNTPNDSHFPEQSVSQINGHAPESANSLLAIRTMTEESTAESSNTQPDVNDASSRLEIMSQEREALRAEVEQLRKSLEYIQGRHTAEISSIQTKHSEELSTINGKHGEETTSLKDQLSEVSKLKEELEESEEARKQAEQQYENLLGRLNTIKASLGERMKADKHALSETQEENDELRTENENLQSRIQGLESRMKEVEAGSNDSSKELSSLRNRHNLSQQNWVSEREYLIQQTAQLNDEAEAAREAMGDWEVLAMEERSVREGLKERIVDIEEQFSVQREAYGSLMAERDSQSQTVDGLQIALRELQEVRKQELRETVESYEEQLRTLRQLVQESDKRATEASGSREKTQAELERLAPFEKEVKEKSLQVGKLRHEAIILNDHLTKALRFLKKAKPEDNIDRQIVTNHFLHFLALDRSDPKKFQILQLIAALLNWTDEQREQAGLARPGTSSGSLRLPASPFFRTPSTPSLSSEFFNESAAGKESIGELWAGFLERSADEGSVNGSRSGSISSAAPGRPEFRSTETGSSKG
ncbi:hypothetical protein BJ878DRAFT_502189 [Calycina marina]|uniref:GRIP domain-containing protein n=1 Tax=Calycina marina TaxID=1763456 RepID=A0A9P7Z471_9HELO|nr:hypothetical protein BJ878DRAFT_502189 [Calycina marina]